MSYRSIDWKLVLVFLLLIALSAGYVINQEAVEHAIKSFLVWPHLSKCIWLAVFVSFFIHYLSVKNGSSSYEGLIYKAFGKFSDAAFAAITYGLASTTSVSILKGVYIQKIIGGEIYFNKFDEIDIYSMLVVCLFLFGYSTYATGQALINALFVGVSKSAKPIK